MDEKAQKLDIEAWITLKTTDDSQKSSKQLGFGAFSPLPFFL